MNKDVFELVELEDGTEALFADRPLGKSEVPEGLYLYDLRGSDDDPMEPSVIGKGDVYVNHAGCLVTAKPLEFPDGRDFIFLGEGLNFLDEELTFEQFKERSGKK